MSSSCLKSLYRSVLCSSSPIDKGPQIFSSFQNSIISSHNKANFICILPWAGWSVWLIHYWTINDAAFPKAALYKRAVGGITWALLLVEIQTTVQMREHMIAVSCLWDWEQILKHLVLSGNLTLFGFFTLLKLNFISIFTYIFIDTSDYFPRGSNKTYMHTHHAFVKV